MQTKEIYILFNESGLPREIQEKMQEFRKKYDDIEQKNKIEEYFNSKLDQYLKRIESIPFITELIKSIINKEYFESKKIIKQTYIEINGFYEEELSRLIQGLKEKNIEEMSQEKESERNSSHDEEKIIEECKKLVSDEYLKIMKNLDLVIDENDLKEYFSSIKIIDNVKTIPLCFPKSYAFNQITNLNNFCIYFENNEISPLERIYFFIEAVMATERMFYQNQKFFSLKKENLFIDKKTNRLMIITFFSPYENNYDWTIYFKGIKDIKEKESYLKTFFNFLKRYCLDNEILKIKLNDKEFNIDSLQEDSIMLWKNKHTFIFSVIKNYIKQFLQVHNLKVFRNYIQITKFNPKIIREAERITNMMLYFFCKSFKYG